MNNFIRRKERSRYKIRSKNKSNNPIIIATRSNKNFYLQLIDYAGSVLVAFSSLNIKDKIKGKSGMDIAKIVAEEFSKKCKEGKFSNIVFDKGPYNYGGRVKAAYDCCKDNGLKI